MMSHEEQVAQHDSIKNIESKVYQINAGQVKGYIITILSVLGSAIAFTAMAVSGFFHYDNNNHAQYASKTDVLELTRSVQELASEMKNRAYVDSVNIINANKNTADIAKAAMEKEHDYNKVKFNQILTSCKQMVIQGIIEKKTPPGKYIIINFN